MPELTGYAERNERQRLRVIELNPSDARNCSGTLDQDILPCGGCIRRPAQEPHEYAGGTADGLNGR